MMDRQPWCGAIMQITLLGAHVELAVLLWDNYADHAFMIYWQCWCEIIIHILL